MTNFVTPAHAGYLAPAGPAYPFVDGYGIPFNPQSHVDYMRAARGDDTFVPPAPTTPMYESDKSKGAGYYDKSSKVTGDGL